MGKLKKRNYYKKNNETAATSKSKMFLLRYKDNSKNALAQEGPYSNELIAKEKLNSLLKAGICTKLV